MLAKLLKYEIPAVARKLAPLYAALIVVSVLFGLNFRGDWHMRDTGVITVITAMLFTAAITAVFIMSIIVMIQRYNDNLMGDGGYFALSLPVTEDMHLLNKTLSAGIWFTIGSVAIVVAIILVIVSSGAVTLWDILKNIFSYLDSIGKVIISVLEVIIMAFAGGCATGLKVYTAITIGHQAKKHIVLAALGVYVGTNVIEVLLLDFLQRIGLTNWISDMMFNMTTWGSWNFSFAIGMIFSLIYCAIYYLICRWFLKNGLNLA